MDAEVYDGIEFWYISREAKTLYMLQKCGYPELSLHEVVYNKVRSQIRFENDYAKMQNTYKGLNYH